MTDPANTSVLSLPPTALAEYQAWLGTVKQRIVSVRLRMALAASRELIQFYWDLGALIAHKQAQSQWGDKLITCSISWDHIPRRSWPLFQAQDVMRGVIESLKGSLPS